MTDKELDQLRIETLYERENAYHGTAPFHAIKALALLDIAASLRDAARERKAKGQRDDEP